MSRPYSYNPQIAHETTAAIAAVTRGDEVAAAAALTRLSQRPDRQIVEYLTACLRDSGAETSLVELCPGSWVEQAVAVLAARGYRTPLEQMRDYWRARGTETPGAAAYALGPHGFVLTGS